MKNFLKFPCLLMAVLLCCISCNSSVSKTEESTNHLYNGVYENENLNYLAFPIGGLGTGMFCLEGTGHISHMSVRNSPDMLNEPLMFATLHVKGLKNGSKVLEGQLQEWRKFGKIGASDGSFAYGSSFNYGMPRFSDVSFKDRFPFGEVMLSDNEIPVDVTITGWNPFIPDDADNSSLPAGILEYTFENKSNKSLETVFSYNSKNFMRIPSKGTNSIKVIKNGFVLSQTGTSEEPFLQGDFAIYTDQPNTAVNHCWLDPGPLEMLTMMWNTISAGALKSVDPVKSDAVGASLYVPLSLKAGERKTIKVFMTWYVPETNISLGKEPIAQKGNNAVACDPSTGCCSKSKTYKPWYSKKFSDVYDVAEYLLDSYDNLRSKTELFTKTFYNTTLPPEVVEAVAANLTILKSTTILREYNGDLWGYEGSRDNEGCCKGNSNHVYNYAQSIPNLFSSLERASRIREFTRNQTEEGRESTHSAIPYWFQLQSTNASDGQLGGIIKFYRDWRISGDDTFLKDLYPKVKKSLDWCIRTWDPHGVGAIEEPHFNTYDGSFIGADILLNGLYLTALNAIVKMGDYLKDDVTPYKQLAEKCKKFTEEQLYNGEYFYQKGTWKDNNDMPKHQFGNGCLSDGMLGLWMGCMGGIEESLDIQKVKSHLLSVFKYNFKENLRNHVCTQRPFAFGNDGGLLLCSWPKEEDKPKIPFLYSDEVWTGIEYQVASHLMMMGEVEKGLKIVRACRDRYDGRIRNPFNEYECGQWYARAMSSYGLIQGLTGVRYDAVEKTLYIDSKIGDFTSFLSTETGYGTVNLKGGKPSVEVVSGTIDVRKYMVSGKELDRLNEAV